MPEVNPLNPRDLPEQNPNSLPQIAAFFDLDNTLMRGASIYHLALGLYRKGILGPSDLATYAITQAKFLASGSENKADFAKVANQTLSFVQNRTATELMELIEEIFEEVVSEKLWPGTMELVNEHLAVGHQVWLISATPVEVAQVIANRLGLTGALATTSEIVDGKYTGNLLSAPVHGPAKAAAVRNLAMAENIDLKSSYAYSDSANDLPLLSLVGNVRVVNPDSQLRDFAKVNDWPTFDFRREHIRRRYQEPLAKSAMVLIGAGAGIALAAIARSRRKT